MLSESVAHILWWIPTPIDFGGNEAGACLLVVDPSSDAVEKSIHHGSIKIEGRCSAKVDATGRMNIDRNYPL